MEGPWLARWVSWAYMAVGRRGGSLNAAEKLYSWVTDNPLFEDVVYKQYWVPSSPWLQGDDPETRRLNEIGELVREDSKVIALLTCYVLLITDSFSTGIPEICKTPLTG